MLLSYTFVSNMISIFSYTFQNQNNVTVEILTYGAIVKSIIAPDKNGVVADICLGFDDMEGKEIF